jgi:hypothetical protein
MGYIIIFLALPLLLCALLDALVPTPQSAFLLGLRNLIVRILQIALFFSPVILWLLSCKVGGVICM